MRETEVVELFADRLRAAGLEYMITGSVACIVYGEPRMTADVAVVLALRSDADADAIARAFPLSEFYAPPREIILAERARGFRGHFNILRHDTGFKADAYLIGRDPLHAWAFARRRRVAVDGKELVFAPPEYVIVRKLEFYREGHSDKHLLDIAGILRVSGDDVGRSEIERLCAERGLESQWRTAQQRE